jgi:hypothetical protein
MSCTPEPHRTEQSALERSRQILVATQLVASPEAKREPKAKSLPGGSSITGTYDQFCFAEKTDMAVTRKHVLGSDLPWSQYLS